MAGGTYIRIKKDTNYNEYQVVYYENGKRDEGRTYYTSDLDDAIQTALAIEKQYGIEWRGKEKYAKAIASPRLSISNMPYDDPIAKQLFKGWIRIIRRDGYSDKRLSLSLASMKKSYKAYLGGALEYIKKCAVMEFDRYYK